MLVDGKDVSSGPETRLSDELAALALCPPTLSIRLRRRGICGCCCCAVGVCACDCLGLGLFDLLAASVAAIRDGDFTSLPGDFPSGTSSDAP